LCFLLLQTPRLFAQVDEGSVTGVIQDPTGAVVPNAKVTLLSTDTGLTLEKAASGSGEYTFAPVKIGHYSVTASAPGFATTTQQNLQVSVNQILQVNIQLKPGSATQTVEVTATAPQLQTQDASVGQVVTEHSINSLPLNGRNFTFLAQLGAGVNTPQNDTRGNQASGAFTANGLRPAQNNYLLDGIDNNSNAVDFLNGTNFVVLPPVDAISEFNVQTSNYSAQLGRAAGAVLNATIKSGTNQLHGTVWEFFRNSVLDAPEWFENNAGIPKGGFRQNQFGVAAGGPIIKDKLFIFGDYEGLRRAQGTTFSGLAVPTLAQRNSGYTNLQDIAAANAGGTPRTDALGRSIAVGTVLDPATTRAVTAGAVDPVTGLTAPITGSAPAGTVGYVRDPFGLSTCASPTTISLAGCPGVNILPGGRVDPNAVKLLNLFPAPTTAGVSSNFASSPETTQNRNAFDIRGDYNLSTKDQMFLRYSYVDNPEFFPGPFGGVADGGAFQDGVQTAKSQASVFAWTHVFTPSVVNVARVGFNHLHTTRFGPLGGQLGIPEQYGIAGIPQVSENGGLPAFGFGGLSTLGSNNFLPSDETSQTLQIVDDFTKIYGSHNFKMGIEYQKVRFSTLQPAWSRGQFDYNGSFTDVPNNNGSTTGIAQFLIPAQAATVANGINYNGGSDQVYASNISKTYDLKNYFAAYFQDDWKINPRLTINLGLRYDYFGPIQETNGGQANFVPSGPPNNNPTYLIPATGKAPRTLSSTADNPSLAGNGFVDLAARDGIAIEFTNKFGQGLVQTQRANFSPRVGFAYQVNPKLVVRGGLGLFFNSFENQGYGPNIGENYPFVYNFSFVSRVPTGGPPTYVAPVSFNTPFNGCPTAGPGGTASFESGFSCIQFSPGQVNAAGLGLQGLQFAYQTPRTLAVNASIEQALTSSMTWQIAYVLTDANHLQTGVGTNNVTQILPTGTNLTAGPGGPFLNGSFLPFPDFGQNSSFHATVGDSIYNGLQTRVEQRFANGLNFLLTYTWSKTFSDAGDLLNGGSLNGYRAPQVPGLGPSFDRGLADFDIRNVFHFSGGYLLPIGKGQHFLNTGGITNALLGGWGINWIATLQGGQPISLSCPTSTTAGTNCNDIKVPGQPQNLGIRISTAPGTAGRPFWFGNPKAFEQPCQLGPNGPIPDSPSGCVPLTGSAVLGGGPATVEGPPLKAFDFSTFKGFQLTERFSMQFRAEFFNIFNHPNFNAPNFGGNGVVAISNSGNFTNPAFGQIGATRGDSREIQFALKVFF
jgi:hypothetical protein